MFYVWVICICCKIIFSPQHKLRRRRWDSGGTRLWWNICRVNNVCNCIKKRDAECKRPPSIDFPISIGKITVRAVVDSGCLRGRGGKIKNGHHMYEGGHQFAESCDVLIVKRVHLTTFCPLEGHLKGTTSCFIYHKAAQESTFVAFLQFDKNKNDSASLPGH